MIVTVTCRRHAQSEQVMMNHIPRVGDTIVMSIEGHHHLSHGLVERVIHTVAPDSEDTRFSPHVRSIQILVDE